MKKQNYYFLILFSRFSSFPYMGIASLTDKQVKELHKKEDKGIVNRDDLSFDIYSVPIYNYFECHLNDEVQGEFLIK